MKDGEELFLRGHYFSSLQSEKFCVYSLSPETSSTAGARHSKITRDELNRLPCWLYLRVPECRSVEARVPLLASHQIRFFSRWEITRIFSLAGVLIDVCRTMRFRFAPSLRLLRWRSQNRGSYPWIVRAGQTVASRIRSFAEERPRPFRIVKIRRDSHQSAQFQLFVPVEPPHELR